MTLSGRSNSEELRLVLGREFGFEISSGGALGSLGLRYLAVGHWEVGFDIFNGGALGV